MISIPASLPGAGTADSAGHAWRMSGAVVLTLAAVFFMYWPSAVSLVQLWGDTSRTTYTHGIIAAAIVVYLVWRKRDVLALLPWAPSIPASLLVAVLGFAWLIAYQGVIEVLHQLLLLALLWTSVWAMFGLRIAFQLWIPVGYLIFAIPAWDQINFLLQGATTSAVALMLKISSIPAFVEGNIVHLAAGVFEVAGGCSGIHFFIVAIALAVLHGEMARDSMKVRIQLVVLAGGLALLANWLRVYIIILAGHLTNMQHWLIQDGHYNFGWGVFATMMLVYLLIARRFALPAHSRFTVQPGDRTPVVRNRAAIVLGAFACIAAAPAWTVLKPVPPAPLPVVGESLPAAPAGWSRISTETPAWHPVFAGADQLEWGDYVDASGQHVAAFVATYAMQRKNQELVAYGNSLVGEGAGTLVSSRAVPSDASARELVVERDRRRALIRYHYRVGDRRTARGIEAQLWYGISAMGGATASSVVAMRAPCVPDCDSARIRLDEFTQ